MQRLQEEADSRLLRTPFSISCSSLTEMALSCQPGPPQEENTPVRFRVHNKRCSGERATGLKACWLQPYVTRQLVKEPPQALLLIRLLLGEAGGGRLRANTRRQHQQGRRPLPSQGGGLTSGRSASTLLPISLWRGGGGGERS